LTIHHALAVVSVSDFDRSHHWYDGFFDRPATNVPMPGQLAEWRITDNGWLQMHRDTEHAGHSLFNLAVDDLDASVTSLRDRGYEPSDITDVNNGVLISSMVDPDGNTITLIGNFREDY
jgi:glyoxylase I family protein